MKQNVILTINRKSEWPATRRSAYSRSKRQNYKVYEFLRDNMSIGDVVSVPVAQLCNAKTLQCALTYYRKVEGTTETLGYRTKVIKNDEGGIELYIRKVLRQDMRRAGKPYSKRPPAVPTVPAAPAVPPLPALPTLPRAGSQM